MQSIPFLTPEVITGRDDHFIDHASIERPLHRDVVAPWRRLVADARIAGFELSVASGYRNYQRQLKIWNDKAGGMRPVFDDCGELLDLTDCDEWTKAQAILRWSALPGASRHHWGTDLDVYDRAVLPEGYQLQLSADESDNLFGAFHRWLDERIAAGAAHGFFRPYREDRGGVSPERWHLSYAPLALRYQRQLDPTALWQALDSPALMLRSVIETHWPTIFERYIRVPERLYPAEFASKLFMNGQHEEPTT